MSLLDRLLAGLAPHECLGCAEEGSILCRRCLRQLAPPGERCYLCCSYSAGYRTCKACRRISNMRSVWPAAAYAEQAKSIIWKLKFGGAQAAAGSMAGLMARAPLFRREQGARRASELVYIVPVPTATGRARQRGFDQAKLLARALSRQTRLPYLDCLARSGQAEQVGASRSQRLGQLEGAFRVKHRLLVRASCLILIDDVLTTGATLEAAAAALKRAGADIIDAVVFAQTEL